MPTTYRHGNILNSEARIIAHGVNAHGTPHTALAHQLFRAYPEAEEDYVRTCVAQTPNVGSVILTILGDGRYLAQLVVQGGRDGHRQRQGATAGRRNHL